jgi:serine/threonine-protein kinase SRPK3
VALKITDCGKEARKSAYEEAEISRHISHVRLSHEGRAYVRLVEESFEIQSSLGDHVCLVFEPLREPLWALGRHLGNVGVPLAVLKPFLKLFFEGLDFLHSECHVIHTGGICLTALYLLSPFL